MFLVFELQSLDTIATKQTLYQNLLSEQMKQNQGKGMERILTFLRFAALSKSVQQSVYAL